MLVKDIKKSKYFTSMDKTFLTELLHPKNEDIKMGCSIAHAVLKPGKSSIPHRVRSVEVYYLLEGKGIMHIEGESKEFRPGQAVYIPPESRQWIENVSDVDLKFLCIVTPPWREEDEEICE